MENKAEKLARRVLETHGFCVKRLTPPEGGRCADYLVEKDSESFILEVTDKKETQFFNDLVSQCEIEGVADGSRRSGFWNRIDGILRDKQEQLRHTPGHSNCPRVLWLSALNMDSHHILDTTMRTVYGLGPILAFDSSGKPSPKKCFYRYNSSFHKYKSIDALILASSDAGRVCLNEFSIHYQSFRTSSLVRMFPPRARVDPLEWEKSGRAFRILSDVCRKDATAIWQYLLDTYGVRTCEGLTSEFLGFITLPADDECAELDR